MFLQKPIDFIDAEPLGRALGQAFQAALRPELSPLGLQRSEV
jgi:hypothetical protein